MTCLRYPDTDPYYPGRVIHLEPSDDAWEMARAWSRRVEVIECDCVAAQRVSGVSGGADERLSEYTGGEHGTAPTGELVPHQPGPGRDSTPTSGRGNRG